MAIAVEGLRGRFRRTSAGVWLLGPEWSIDGQPKQAQTLDEFIALSKEARARAVDLHASVREIEPNVHELGVSASSWRGDHADLVVLRENFDPYSGDISSSEGQTIQLRLMRTLYFQLDSIRQSLPKAKTSVGSQILYMDRSRPPGTILFIDSLESGIMSRLEPLTPRPVTAAEPSPA